jgi:hypothetical protein
MDTFKATLEAWQPFFTAQLGAAAALGGLLFVGLSLNLAKILAYPALPMRALIALALLLVVLIVSSVMLIPEQTEGAVAIEILVIGLAGWASATVMNVYAIRGTQRQNRTNYIANMIIQQFAALPFVIGGALLLGGRPGGLYVVSVGVMISFVKAMLDAWVLLVEINR